MNPKNPQAAGELRERDRERFSDAGFNRWLDEGVSDGGHTVYDYIGGHESIPAAWHGWQAYADYSRPDDYESEPPTALQIEYARGYGDGVKHGESLAPPADPPAAGDVNVVVSDLRRLGKEDGWLCATAGAGMIEALLAAQEAARG